MAVFKNGNIVERFATSVLSGSNTLVHSGDSATVTSGNQLHLTSDAAKYQIFSGSSTSGPQVYLPYASGSGKVALGQQFVFINNSSTSITLATDLFSTALGTVPAGTTKQLICAAAEINGVDTPWTTGTNTAATTDPSYFLVTDKTSLAAAIAKATTAGGGIIELQNSFSIDGVYTIPSGTVLKGRQGAAVITVTRNNGNAALSLASGAVMRDVWMSGGTVTDAVKLLLLYNSYALVENCQFTLTASNTDYGYTMCIDARGYGNRMYKNSFVGVVGKSNAGILYAGNSIDNVDTDSLFFP